MSMNGTLPTPEDIKRVKGLGFLHDKTTADCFNARVITRNGRLQPDEIRAIVDAAEKFGSGEIAMTTRLTIEVQRIPFANIEPFCAFLAEHGLETGGTGPKVRPIVACKGTTCQYGLIDTVAFSRTIHERFYKGWHDVRLPHKFKIAVGGCPNNCVKPDLNDLGVIGQRVPSHDLSKCRGCKVCQIEKPAPSAQAVWARADSTGTRRCATTADAVSASARSALSARKSAAMQSISAAAGASALHRAVCSRTYSRARRKCSRSSSVPSPCSATRATPVSVSRIQ